MRKWFIGVLLLALFALFILAVAPVRAGGEGWGTNCPGRLIAELDGSGVMVHCAIWSFRCSDVVKIYNNGTSAIFAECDNGKPTPAVTPEGPPPNQGGL